MFLYSGHFGSLLIATTALRLEIPSPIFQGILSFQLLSPPGVLSYKQLSLGWKALALGSPSVSCCHKTLSTPSWILCAQPGSVQCDKLPYDLGQTVSQEAITRMTGGLQH